MYLQKKYSLLTELTNIWKRYRSIQTSHIYTLPVVILMPHSACNCRCVMCDIWKGNHKLKQLSEADIAGLVENLRKLGTKQVVMSGGEALLHPQYFRFCALLKQQGFRITTLSTGLLVEKHAAQLVRHTDELILSLDGDDTLHDQIRNMPGAYEKLERGIKAVQDICQGFPIRLRSVIHARNFRQWPALIEAAEKLGVQQISFLPADTTSTAFNRPDTWDAEKQQTLIPDVEELAEMILIIQHITERFPHHFTSGFIAEKPEKLWMILRYYRAQHGLEPFPYKPCNAPWVSAVVEADGSVRPCFFHEPYGKLNGAGLDAVLNSEAAIQFRKMLSTTTNPVCERCVCSLYLSPTQLPA
jgi:MoaA/NifB/PqqE/SkfB family radical SAM enzyme